MMEGKNKEHKVLTKVYYIPRLKINIISLGQLEESGCKITLEDGKLCIFDRERVLLARVLRKNKLYTLKLDLAAPVCLLSKTDDIAWLWHGRYGHMNFRSLRELGLKKMVDGVPLIDHVEQFCDGCALASSTVRHFRQQLHTVLSAAWSCSTATCAVRSRHQRPEARSISC